MFEDIYKEAIKLRKNIEILQKADFQNMGIMQKSELLRLADIIRLNLK